MADHWKNLSDPPLLRILQHLEDVELYVVSMTGRRWHKLALSELLSRHRISDPLETALIHLGENSISLQALRIALFVPSIRHLSLSFSPGIQPWMVDPYPLTREQLRTTAAYLRDEMERCMKLLKRLRSVDRITVSLPGSLEWNLRDVSLERGSTSAGFDWIPILSFFQAIVEKSCTSLEVRNSHFYARGRTFSRSGKEPTYLLRNFINKIGRIRPKADFSALARRDGKKYQANKLPQILRKSLGSDLTTFSVNSTVLLFPSIADWTFSVLMHSPLVSLNLSKLSVSEPDWNHIASKLAAAVPNLQELILDDPRISPNCLLWLLNRLSMLTSLSLGSDMVVYLIHPRLFPPFSSWYIPAFRALTKLTASPSYISLFLMRSNPLPILTEVTLPTYEISRISTAYHKPIFTYIPRLLRRIREIKHNIAPPPLTITFGGEGSNILRSMSRNIDAFLAIDVKDSDSIREIIHVVLEKFDPQVDSRDVARWLRLFPCLRRVSLDGPDGQSADIYRLAYEISRACPTMETLAVNGVHHDIASVLCSPVASALPGFADLPADVLLLIFDFLHLELFHLSLLCRRLHFIALPIFLARTNAETVLTALTVSLFVPSIKHLECVFPDPPHLYMHLDRIRLVTRLVNKLMTVEKVSLSFTFNTYQLRNVGQEYKEQLMWKTCHSALEDLLAAVTSKSCTSLIFHGFPVPVGATYVAAPPSLCNPSISILSLDVDYPGSYSSWILEALKTCPIISLDLTITGATSQQDVVCFLPSVANLSLHGSLAPRGQILDLLHKHPDVKTLNLAGELSIHNTAGNPLIEGPHLEFNNLVTLAAPPSYISYFLMFCAPFPRLENLRIILDDVINVGWDLASTIERVIERYPSMPVLTVEVMELRDRAAITDSVNSISSLGGKWRHASRYITRLIITYRSWWFSPMATGLIVPQQLLSWLTLFAGPREIHIRVSDLQPSESLFGFATSIGIALPSVQVVYVNGVRVFQR
ncbi:hypothetical protein B0H10DRAFT_2017661 [Mycena sp. CBHHK59/15]|nr:hypothetical protein B0H10DRAFT_2017661 [Mycena sp. CBHHK59/15]